MTSDFYLGLDLGQATDYTALCVVERPDLPDRSKPLLNVRHLHRFPLGTPYPDIVADVVKCMKQPSLERPKLIVDATGVGKAVVDLFKKEGLGSLVPVLITGGHQTTQAEDGSWHVPKKELVSILQVLLQTRRLKLAPNLPEGDTLLQELQHFQVKVTLAGNETFGAGGLWRERKHDDMVLALALACWHAVRFRRFRAEDIVVGGESILDRFPPGVFLDIPLPSQW